MVNDENKDDMKEFEEEFDFESEDTIDPLPIEDEDDLSHPTRETDNRSSAQGISIDKKPSKLPWLIGLAAAGFIGWQGYKIIFAEPVDETAAPVVKQESKAQTSKSTNTPQPITQSKPETLPMQIQPDLTSPAHTPQTATSEPPSKSPDLFTAPPPTAQPISTTIITKPAQLDTLEENIKKSQERMGKLESKFSELMDSMGTLNQGMSQVTRELSTINDSVQKLNKDVKTLKSQSQPQQASQPQAIQRPLSEGEMQPIYSGNKYETKPTVPSQMTVSVTPMMSVHAIIPGRAWLKSRDGSTITVTEGDSLDRYGKVLVIDASNGVVITSSGVTLR